jgi:hypothetical protein
MFGTQNILGLALDELGIVATELEVRSDGPHIRRTGEFLWEQEFQPAHLRPLGEQFRQFLRDHHFSARQAVVGLGAKWVLAKELALPPVTSDALAGVLSIQAERAFSLNAEELIFDYCGRADATEKSRILLTAAQRQLVEQVRELASVAGLQVQSVTISALALGDVRSAGDAEQGHGLYLRPTYCEFWSLANGRLQSLHYVPMPAWNGSPSDDAQSLVSAIRRWLLLSPHRDQSSPHQVAAYAGCGLPEEIVARLNEQLAPEIVVTDATAGLPAQALGAPQDLPERRSLVAAAVALTATRPDGPAVDFLNSKMGVKKTSHRKRIVTWAAILGAALLVATGALLADWRRDTLDIAAYTQQLEQMSDDITAAREIVDRVSYAGSWTSRQPRFLECLRELTEAFPQEPVVWATSLALDETGKGTLIGKTNWEESFYEVLDKIKAKKAFAEVKMIHIRDAGKGSREKEFAVSFTFGGAK